VSDVSGDVGVTVAVASGNVCVVVEARGRWGVSDVGGAGLRCEVLSRRRADALDVQEKERTAPHCHRHWRILSRHKEWQGVCRLNMIG